MLDFDEIFETLLKKVRLLNGKGVTFFGQFFEILGQKEKYHHQ